MSTRVLVLGLGLALFSLACADSSPAATTAEGESGSSGSSSETGDETGEGTETGGEEVPELETVTLTHSFGTYGLGPFEETQPCVQWTLDNDASIYAQGVTLSNLGYFHHSNWFVVPEDIFAGPDGYFDCSERGFSENLAAALGTVLTAQSTQSFAETQRTQDGAVIKLPARHKIVAATHMLNVGPASVETELFVSLDLIHPRDVESVLAPFRLTYFDLDIPANGESRFTGVCDGFGEAYASGAKTPVDLELHYVLPHFHYLGNYFGLEVLGGEYEGETVFELDGFNGEANGQVFDPPLDMSGIDGFRFTCGYDNWRDENVGWGVGDQEMCVMLGLFEGAGMGDVTVNGGTVAVGQQEGVNLFEGVCDYFIVTKGPGHTMPSDEEIEDDWQIPASGDDELPPIPECSDHDPSVSPNVEATLANVASVVFEQSCAFNACHGSASAVAGLDLTAPDLLTELLEHEVVGNPGAALVEPGDPEGSWLYQIMANCDPVTDGGTTARHMPLNAPVLLSDPSVALVREWIAGGAQP